jgi:chromosomal replication initiation ATPase DnaA
MPLSPGEIIGQVACITGVPVGSIQGKRRTRAVTEARFLVIAAISKRYPWWSGQELAGAISREDPGTAYHAIKRFKTLIVTNPHFQAMAREMDLI